MASSNRLPPPEQPPRRSALVAGAAFRWSACVWLLALGVLCGAESAEQQADLDPEQRLRAAVGLLAITAVTLLGVALIVVASRKMRRTARYRPPDKVFGADDWARRPPPPKPRRTPPLDSDVRLVDDPDQS